MRKRRKYRNGWVGLATAIAFVAHGVALYMLIPPLGRDVHLVNFSQPELVLIGSMGLVSLAAASLGLKVFIRRSREAWTKLSRSEEFARATVDALPSQIAIVDQWGAIVSINESWEQFAKVQGIEKPVAIGEGASYLAECDRAAARGCPDATVIGQALRAVLGSTAEHFTHEYAAHTPSRRQWFQVRITRFPGEGLPCAVVAHEDITARKLAEERHESAKRDAEAANAAKSAFIANTSHEIRTPMNAILGYAEMLLDKNRGEEYRQNCVKVIRRNGQHLLAIINDILDLSKVEACRMSAERISCDLPQLIADVIGLTKPKAVEKGLRFEVTFDDTIPRTFTTDPVRAKQVLVNLVANAIKFTPAGAVRIHVSHEISYFNQTLRFDITDTGIGMTEEQIGKLFQPFTQADASTTREFGGTGLGLTISKRLAQILGGGIDLKSTPGKGSTFSFFVDGGSRENVEYLKNFTQDQLDVPDFSPARETPEIHLQGKVLLAEDGEDNQHLLITFLQDAGIEVDLVVDGGAAVQAALEGKYDMVLMDMQMPVMDGYGATAELRTAGFDKPIVALTAHAMAEDRVKCLKAGCSDYLTKPIDRHLLLSTCAQYLKAAILDLKPVEKGRPLVNDSSDPNAPLRSTLAHDSRVAKVLDGFIARLPQRVRDLQESLDTGDTDALRHALHNLKGAGAGFGFGPLSEQSSRTEQALSEDSAVDDIRRQVEALIALIQRVEGYDPAPRPPAMPLVPVTAA